MRHSIALIGAGLLAAGALAASAAAQAEPSIDITDAVARVTVIPEARSDIKVEIVTANPKLPLRVHTQGDRTIIDGEMRRGRIRSCSGAGEATQIQVAGVGPVAWRDMPQIVVRTPRDVILHVGGAVYGVIGRSASLEFGQAGCGDWTVGNVAGDMRISQAGSGNTRAGAAGSARLRVTGTGDIAVADIRNGLIAEVAGTGDVRAASLAGGALVARIAGSGDVWVLGGHADAMTAGVAGVGNVGFGGVAETLKARITGSGDVRVRQVRGTATKAIIGSGQVRIGR